MRKASLIISILLIALFVFGPAGLCQVNPKDDKAKVDQFVDKLKETANKYTTTVDSFNGVVTVNAGGNTETIVLTPGESLKVPKDTPPEKGIVTWKSVTQYENDMMIGRDWNDRRVRWFVENIQTDRVNRILTGLKDRFKKEWENNNPGRKASDRLSFYMPGDNDTQRYASIGDIIDEIVDNFGMMKETPFTKISWKAKFITGNEQLYKADLRDLAQEEGLLPYYTTIESLIKSSSSFRLASP
jgi:hypothetical protein